MITEVRENKLKSIITTAQSIAFKAQKKKKMLFEQLFHPAALNYLKPKEIVFISKLRE